MITKPDFKKLANGYSLYWEEPEITVLVKRLTDEGKCELSINNHNSQILPPSNANLLSIQTMSRIGNHCKAYADIDWTNALSYVCKLTMEAHREGDPVVMLTEEFGKVKPAYILYPLFVKDAFNIIYADRSSAKSTFITMVDLALSLPWWDNPLGLDIPRDVNHKILFCDWESNASIIGWQKECLIRGMGIGWCDIPYLHCAGSLADKIDHISDKVAEVGADIIIIDSLGMAVGDDLNITKPAFAFFSALRQLPVTPIAIGHTSKDRENRYKTVYGNAYYENEARSIWEASKEQNPGDAELTLTLHHRKPPPFGAIHEPLAYRFLFGENTISIEQADPVQDKRNSNIVATEVILEAVRSECNDNTDRISPAVLIELTGIGRDNVYQSLKRLKDKNLIGKDRDGYYPISD